MDGRGHSGGRWRRERMNPQQEKREAIPAGRPGAGGLASGRRSARTGSGFRGGGGALQAMAGAGRRSARDRRGDPGYAQKYWGAFGRSWRTGYGGSEFRWGKRIPKQCGGGEVYRSGVEGSEERAHEAARTDGISVRYGSRPVDWYRLRHLVLEERMEQVREIDGEQAYEKMRLAVEKANQRRAAAQFPSRDRPERSGPKRGGPERDYGPSR